MKVCTCFLLFRIFAHAHSLTSSSAAENQESSNLEDTAQQFSDEDTSADNTDAQYDSVKGYTKNVKTDIKSNLNNIFRAPSVTFTGFIEEVIKVINTFEDTKYEDFIRTLDVEIRKYHYHGCIFSELTNKYDTRKFLASTLKMIREQPISVTRSNINEMAKMLKQETYDENVKELLDYINSLYVNAGEKFLNVINGLEQFNTKSTVTDNDMGSVIKNGVRTILFDYYTNLSVTTRRDLKHKIDTFWRHFKLNLTSRRANVNPQSKPFNTVKNSKYGNEVKKFKPVSNMERNKKVVSKKAKELIQKYRINKNRFETKDVDYKTMEIKLKQGIKYGPKSNYENEKPNDPFISLHNRGSFRRSQYIQTTNSIYDMDPHQYENTMEVEGNIKQHIESNTEQSEISEEHTPLKLGKTFAANMKRTPTKSPQDRRREMVAELMKPTPQISFYLSTNPYKLGQFALPTAIKTHYKIDSFNETAKRALRFREVESENKFEPDAKQRTYSSVEKDTHVIKRIKVLETQLKKVKNKVSIVNSEVVKIKKVLFKTDANSSQETDIRNIRSRAKSDSNTSPDDFKVTKDTPKTTGATDDDTEVLIAHKFKAEVVNNDKQDVEVTKPQETTKEVKKIDLTKSVYDVTPNFKAKDIAKKEVTTKRFTSVNEPDKLKSVRTTKDINKASMDFIKTSATKATKDIKANVAVTTSKPQRLLTKPVFTKVGNSSQSLNVSKTTDLNNSIDVNDAKTANNYVIRVY